MENNLFSDMIAGLEDGFNEMDSNITFALQESDKKYADIKERIREFEQKFPFIESILDGDGSVRLSAEEHARLVDYIRTSDEAENRERLNLYLAGHRDCITYLKRIGVL